MDERRATELTSMVSIDQIRTCNADKVMEVAGRFSVFTVPLLLLFIEGTESLREARFVQLEQKLKRVCQLYEE